MDNECHELAISSRKNGKTLHEELEVNESSVLLIKKHILAETLVTLGAVYGNEEWAIDIACEGSRSYIIIIEIPTGSTYTYLNPVYANLFVPSETAPNILLCEDMDEFEEKEEHRDALAEIGINGNDCPALHVCEDKSELIKIVNSFLTAGEICPEVNWLKS